MNYQAVHGWCGEQGPGNTFITTTTAALLPFAPNSSQLRELLPSTAINKSKIQRRFFSLLSSPPTPLSIDRDRSITFASISWTIHWRWRGYEEPRTPEPGTRTMVSPNSFFLIWRFHGDYGGFDRRIVEIRG